MAGHWKADHQEQHEAVQAGKRFFWPPDLIRYWGWQFESAVQARGEQAREAAVDRGELKERPDA